MYAYILTRISDIPIERGDKLQKKMYMHIST